MVDDTTNCNFHFQFSLLLYYKQTKIYTCILHNEHTFKCTEKQSSFIKVAITFHIVNLEVKLINQRIKILKCSPLNIVEESNRLSPTINNVTLLHQDLAKMLTRRSSGSHIY